MKAIAVTETPGSESLRDILGVAVRAREAQGLDATLDAAAVGLQPLGVDLFLATLEGCELRRSRPPGPGAVRSVSIQACAPAGDCLKGRAVVFVPSMGEALAHLAGTALALAKDDAPETRQAWLCPIWVHEHAGALLCLHADAHATLNSTAIALLALQLGSAVEACLITERASWRSASLRALAVAGRESVPERLVTSLLSVVAEASQSDTAAFYVMPAGSSELIMIGSHGGEVSLSAKYQRLSSLTVNAEATRTKNAEAFHIRDWTRSAPRDDLLSAGFSELAVVPRHSQGRLTGVLNLIRRAERPYTREELDFAGLLAEQISVQLENNRLFEDAHQQLRQLALLFELSRIGAEKTGLGPMINGLVERTALALSADSALLFLLTEDRMMLTGEFVADASQAARFRTLRDLPFGEGGPLARAVTERKTICSDSELSPSLPLHEGDVIIVTPLIVKMERAMGVLALTRPRLEPFDLYEIELLESCAGLFAAAIDRTLTLESQRQRKEVLEALNELGGLIANQFDLAEVSRSALGQLSRLCDVPDCFLFLADEDGKSVRLTATNRDDIASDRVVAVEDPSVVAVAMYDRKPMLVNDASSDQRLSLEVARHFGHRALLAVPLISEGRALGAIVLAETRAGRRFLESDVERAVAVGNQLAVAITNAQLYSDLQRSYQDLGRAQEALVRRERLAAVGELAALVAHEVRNPLAVIFNSIASLRRILTATVEGDMLLDIVGQEAERLNQLVGDFLDFARPNEPDMQLASLLPVLEAAVEAATGTHEGVPVTVRFEVPAAPPLIPFDPRLVRQAFVNLVVNALQAMPKGGQATLRVTQQNHRNHPHVRVDVSDTGMGVPAGIRARLFQPFFTTKASGTGLGLAVVKRIIEAHRGDVTVESTPNRGTTFTVWLPLAGDAPPIASSDSYRE